MPRYQPNRNPEGVFTEFNPAVHGFPFGNHWKGDILLTIPHIGRLDIGDTTYGLCGGMCYAALDTFLHHGTTSELPGDPSRDDSIQSYIYGRQMDSIKGDDAHLVRRLLSWIPKPLKTRYGITGLKVLSHRRFLRSIARSLDGGVPVPLCLVNASSRDLLRIGKKNGFALNHQVLAIGYRYHDRAPEAKAEWDIYIYDPNYPGETQILHTASRSQTRPSSKTKLGPRFRAFFNTHYRTKRPPWCGEKKLERSVELVRMLGVVDVVD